MPIRAVIFDFNGVLVDDEQIHFELFREVLDADGVGLDADAYHERYLGFDDRGCFTAALADAGREAPAEYVDELIARKAARYAEVAAAGLSFFPSAAQTMSDLAEGRTLAVCSGALRAEIDSALGRLDVRGLVAEVVSAEDTGRCKPDPEGYLLALDRLRARLPGLDAGECMAIEDSLAGVAAARAAGMVAVGVTNTYRRDELTDAGASALVEGLAEITPAWVDELSPGRDHG